MWSPAAPQIVIHYLGNDLELTKMNLWHAFPHFKDESGTGIVFVNTAGAVDQDNTPFSDLVNAICGHYEIWVRSAHHYSDVIMGAIASQITSLTIVYLIVYSDADQRKHQSSPSLAFVWGINRWPMNFPHKGPVTRKIYPFDDVIIIHPQRVLGSHLFRNLSYPSCLIHRGQVTHWRNNKLGHQWFR